MAAQPRSISRIFHEAIEAHRKGDLKQAEHLCLEILATAPNDANANYLLGIIACKSGDVRRGSRLIHQATISDPDNFMAHNSLGMTQKELGELEAAEKSYQRAITLKPDFFAAYNNLGIVLRMLGKFEEAAACCRRAISLKPDLAEAHNNLGIALACQGLLGEAVASYHKAIGLEKNFFSVYNNLGIALEEQGKIEEAVESYRKALSFKKDFTLAHSSLLFALNSLPAISQPDIFSESIHWYQQHVAGEPARKIPHRKINKEKKRRLKVGYVSPDFCRHPVANFFEPLLKEHNRKYFEIYLYANVLDPDYVTQRLRDEADHWLSIVGKSDKEVAETISRDEIDILVDLAGHTANNRLMVFAYRPAPVQVTWLGYPNTTGLQEMDYRFTDAIADPLTNTDDYYSEELLRLDNGFLCYMPDDFAPQVSPPPYLDKGYVTFGSFNNLKKINKEVIRLWARILRAEPNTRLVLKNKSFQDRETRKRYLKWFVDEEIAEDRVILHAALPHKKDHLAFYSKIDIGLDTFPYNGTTTTCEALWMGVPVVTISGDRHAGRVGASILHHAGFGNEFIAKTPEEYVSRAVNWANDLAGLVAFRKSARQKIKRSALCDAEKFAREVEESYDNIWQRYLRQSGK